MKRREIKGKMLLFAVLGVFSIGASIAQEFTFYNSWDFEGENLGDYTDDEIRQDFDIVYLYSHQSSDIVMEEINGTPTKVMRVTHEAQKTSVGWQSNIDLGKDFDEVYFSFDIKLSENWNSTGGGKLPGFGSLPPYTSGMCPEYNDGFGSINLFKQGGKIYTYHYDHTTGSCPWSGETYDYDQSYISNGNWYNITQRLVMNTFTNGVANSDGIKELWVDGRLVHQESNLKLMMIEHDTMKIDALRISNFYGGLGDAYSPITECYAYFDNFKVYVPNNDPTLGTHNLHSPNEVISTPDEIIQRNFTYDKLITEEQSLSNSEYGSPYSPCIDEVYVIDAGEGNKVNFEWNHTIGGGDYLFFYDGNRTDSKLLKVYKGYSNQTNQNITTTGRYLTIRFSVDKEGESTGWKGTVSFNSDGDPDPAPPVGCTGEIILATEAIKAANYSYIKGAQVQVVNGDSVIGYLDNDCYVGYCNLNFNLDINAIELNMAVHPDHTSKIEIRIDDPDGTLIGEISTISTGDWEIFGLQEASILNITGVHDVYFISTEVASGIIDWFRFLNKPAQQEANHHPEIYDQTLEVLQNDESTTFVGTVSASDVDGDNLTYRIIKNDNKNNFFTIDETLGNIYCETQKLDFINEKTYNLIVQVQDDGPGSLTQEAEITIQLKFTAQAYYIDPENNSDPLKDGSKEHPFSSWSEVSWADHAYYLQKKGTTATEDKISIYANNVTLGAYGEGDKPEINSNALESAIKMFNKTNIHIQDLHILAEKAISCIYIYGEESDENLIKNCTIEGAENGVRVIDGKTVTFCYNSIRNCVDAIYSYAKNNKVYYNVLKFNTNAINITSSLSNSEIYNNVFYENGTGVNNSYSDLKLHNNIFYLASAGDVALNQKLDQLLSDNNIFFPERDGFLKIGDNTYSSLSDYQEKKGLDLNSFASDPLFVDVYNNDFDLEQGSPAIDAGTVVGLELDFFGHRVPLGGAPDIGISEKIASNYTETQNERRQEKSNDLFIYPNPSNGYLNIRCKNIEDQTSNLYIKDLTGRTVYKRECSVTNNILSQTVDITELPSGIYVILLQFADKLYSQRISRIH